MFDRAGFGALVRARRGQLGLTQAELAEAAFGDATRKGDVSRVENGRILPQEATIRALCNALEISEAEMAPIRRIQEGRDETPFDRAHILALAARFGIEDADAHEPSVLSNLFEQRAVEYRALHAQMSRLDPGAAAFADHNRKGLDALGRGDAEVAARAFAAADRTLTERLADTKATRARLALDGGDTELACIHFRAAAAGFDNIKPAEGTRRLLQDYVVALREHALAQDMPARARALEAAAALASERLSDDLRLSTPGLWALGQTQLARVLMYLGATSTDPEALAFAVDAGRAAVEASDLASQPEEWALAQDTLGQALRALAERSQVDAATALFADAIHAHRAALQVRRENTHPLDWAASQHGLGHALRAQGILSDVSGRAQALGQAVTAFCAALTVRTAETHPGLWRATMHGLGRALHDLGNGSADNDGAALLARSAAVLRAALKAHDQANAGAALHEDLARAEAALAQHPTVRQPQPHLSAALQHAKEALRLYQPMAMGADLARADALLTLIRDKMDAPAAPITAR